MSLDRSFGVGAVAQGPDPAAPPDLAAVHAWIDAFPGVRSAPFHLHPPGLYTVADLYDAFDPARPQSWAQTYDHRAWAWFIDPQTGRPRALSIGEALAARIHDAVIEQAIDAHLAEHSGRAIGFMGGHDYPRDDAAFRQVAILARALRRKGLQIVTGGGPGLMEAANFGAFLAPFDDARLDQTFDILRGGEFSVADPAAWLRSGCEARASLLGGDWRAAPPAQSRNLGIPTWHYGKEPPNLFATAIGKYFYNSVREDGLIGVASGGVVFAPGASGTVQEIFQNANNNAYPPLDSKPTPMVFFGRDFWDPATFDAQPRPPGAHRKPVFPLVRKLARDFGFEDVLLISDDIDEVIGFLEAADMRHPQRRSIAERQGGRIAAL
ncbi:MAG TPA: hypothetical protein VG248_01005 [Caulobacteraceae bacterium]|nr:hypothetical protein [Caulobacteraceae bacterium]